MKKYIVAFFLVLFFTLFTSAVPSAAKSATAPTTSADDIYSSQLEQSGANDLMDKLPAGTQNTLNDLNIQAADWRQLNSLSLGQIFSALINIAGDSWASPFNSMLHIFGVILLCALLNGFNSTLSSSPLIKVMDQVSTLCICAAIIYPFSLTISLAAQVINSSASFVLMFVPVLVGVMISCGQAVTGGSYYTAMMCAANVVSQISSQALVPLLNVFLGVSVVGTLSSKINLRGVCSLIEKVVKWTLTFVMSVFVTMLTMQTFIGTAADTTGNRAARFAISSFVPLVGGALSEAFSTVQNCLKLLKSGIGVFAILGTAFTFLPAVFQCIMWLVTLNICAAAADLFGSCSTICTLLRSCGKVISTLLAILLCCMVIFIVSTTIVLCAAGGGGA